MRTTLALVLALVVLAPAAARADGGYDFDLDLDFDFSEGIGEMMLYAGYGSADVGLAIIDLAKNPQNRNLAVCDILVGGSQVAIFGYRTMSGEDDDRRAIDAVMTGAGALLLLRGVYLSARPLERRPAFVPIMVGGNPGLAFAGKF